MPLFVVSAPSGRQVIVNASSPEEAVRTGNTFVGGPAQARLATFADAQTIPLLGPLIKGDNRPAIQSDPEFVTSMGLLPKPGDTDFIGPLPDGRKDAGLSAEDKKRLEDALAGKKRDAFVGMDKGDGADGRGLPGLSDLLAPSDLFDALFRRGLAGRFGTTPSGVGSSIAGRAALQRQPEFENVFGFQRGLAGFQDLGSARDQAFEDFVRNTTGGGLGGEALNAFRILSGLAPGPVPGATETFRTQFGGPNENQANQLAGLTGSALGAGVSPLALDLLRFPSGKDLRSQFIAETGGGPEADFIEFLRRNFPLASTIR